MRGEVHGTPLTRHEHDALYARAMTGSRSEGADYANLNDSAMKHAMTAAFAKLGVEDIIEAFWQLGWLQPLPYGINQAEVDHERLTEGETVAHRIEAMTEAFEQRINERSDMDDQPTPPDFPPPSDADTYDPPAELVAPDAPEATPEDPLGDDEDSENDVQPEEVDV